jgi:hypothetical protein
MWTREGVCIREGFGVIMRSLIELIHAARFAIKFTYYTISSNSYWDYAIKASHSY